MHFMITTSMIVITLYNGNFTSHYLEPNNYETKADQIYTLPPTIIYNNNSTESYYHYTDHFLVTLVNTMCDSFLWIDEDIKYLDQSDLRMQKISAGYHNLFVYADDCEPYFEYWIYNVTENPIMRTYNNVKDIIVDQKPQTKYVI